MKLAALTVPPAGTTGPVEDAIENASAFETPPPGAGLDTVTRIVPALAMSAARIDALNCVELTKIVLRGLPFQFTIDPDTKLAPLTVRTKFAAPAEALDGASEVSPGTGLSA